MHWMNVSYTTKFACLNAKTLYYWFKIGSQSTLKLGIANYIIVQNGCKYPHFQLFYNKPFVCLYKGVILSVFLCIQPSDCNDSLISTRLSISLFMSI